MTSPVGINEDTIQVLDENEKRIKPVKKQAKGHNVHAQRNTNSQLNLDKATTAPKEAFAQMEKSEASEAEVNELAALIEHGMKMNAEKERIVQQSANKFAKLRAEVNALKLVIQDRDKTIVELNKRVGDNKDSIERLQQMLKAKEDELTVQVDKLKELGDCSVKMVPGSTNYALNLVKATYVYARNVALNFLGEDLCGEDLKRHTDEIRKLVPSIPLPPSNTPYAKRLRVIAFLSYLGRMLADKIFIPFYLPSYDKQLVPNGVDNITTLLSNLSHEDSKMEVRLRSFLLAISSERQREAAFEAANQIALQIDRYFGVFLNADRRTQFQLELQGVCRKAVNDWNELRSFVAKVEPFTETLELTRERWCPTNLDDEFQSRTSMQLNRRPSQQANGKQNSPEKKSSTHSLNSWKVVALVWPGFSYNNVVLKRSYMLLESQIKMWDNDAEWDKDTESPRPSRGKC